MEILKLNEKTHHKVLPKAELVIKQGGVVVCPTDTVYGLLCEATNKKAVNKVLKIKKRKANKPIPIFVKDIKMARNLTLINKSQEKFLKRVWPGKVTVVLKTKKGKKTIGLRIPDYKFVNRLLVKINKPLTGTSANISGQSASIKIKEVLRQFEGRKYQPDLVLDAGNLKKSKPSMVVDITVWPPKILRS